MKKLFMQKYDIWHMMIDKSYQGRGYAQDALRKCLEYIDTKPFGNSNRVVLTCNKENGAALHIYKKAGFSLTGEQDEEEVEMVFDNFHPARAFFGGR